MEIRSFLPKEMRSIQFADAASQVLSTALGEGRRNNHTTIGTGWLFYALSQNPAPNWVGLPTRDNAVIRPEDILRKIPDEDLERQKPEASRPYSGYYLRAGLGEIRPSASAPGFSSNMLDIIKEAQSAAGDNEVDSEHLLYALSRRLIHAPEAFHVMAELQVDRESFRKEVTEASRRFMRIR